MKTCFKCGQTKPLEKFHAHKGMKDGRLNKCGECTTKDVREWRLKQPAGERTRRYERELETGYRTRKAPQKYGRDPVRRLINSAKYLHKKRTQSISYTEFDDFAMDECKLLCKLREEATGYKWQVDHIIPLSHKKASGLHNGFNIQSVPARWNQSKSNRSMEKYWPPYV